MVDQVAMSKLPLGQWRFKVQHTDGLSIVMAVKGNRNVARHVTDHGELVDMTLLHAMTERDLQELLGELDVAIQTYEHCTQWLGMAAALQNSGAVVTITVAREENQHPAMAKRGDS
jgi:hypothetical protein